MKTQVVTDIYRKKVVIALDTKKVVDFNNKDKEISYSAKIVEDGQVTKFWADFKEEGIITDTETKISAFGNVVALAYANAVGFNQPENDPEKKLWKEYIAYVDKNKDEFFTKFGDWKKRIKADLKQGLSIIEVK